MKYMIMLYASQQDFDAMAGKATGKPVWSGEQLAAMGAFMGSVNDDLVASGELVDAQGLTAPVHTRRLSQQNGALVITDGPFPETQEVLAGYTIVDCESFDRATQIGVRMTQCPPGPSGTEGLYLDIRPIMDNFEDLSA